VLIALMMTAACHRSTVAPHQDSLPDTPPTDSEPTTPRDTEHSPPDDSGADTELAQGLVDSLDADRFRATIGTLAGFGDRSVGSSSNTEAFAWAAQELEGMGYEVQHQAFSYGGTSLDNLWVTRTGSTQPDSMYILGAHLDGRGGGGGADDDASGSALILELARAFAEPDIQPEISVRFALWNAEEVGLVGSEAYVSERRALQGIEDPPGSGLYPEPSWLGMVQHDMILFDHGVPAGPEQIPEADIDVEYQSSAVQAAAGQALGEHFLGAAGRYTATYPAELGPDMSNTDSASFQNHTASISVRENRRGTEIGAGSNPHWHQPTDVPETYSDADYALGMDAVRMTAGAIAELCGLHATE
jgi:hypothetical protein